ncbi:hypothetical protein ALC60_05380, partial [Trachymyrmex zeteki]
ASISKGRSTNGSNSSNARASGCPIILVLMKAGLSERLSIPSITHTTRLIERKTLYSATATLPGPTTSATQIRI